jgi:hypothetical protein
MIILVNVTKTKIMEVATKECNLWKKFVRFYVYNNAMVVGHYTHWNEGGAWGLWYNVLLFGIKNKVNLSKLAFVDTIRIISSIGRCIYLWNITTKQNKMPTPY